MIRSCACTSVFKQSVCVQSVGARWLFMITVWKLTWFEMKATNYIYTHTIKDTSVVINTKQNGCYLAIGENTLYCTWGVFCKNNVLCSCNLFYESTVVCSCNLFYESTVVCSCNLFYESTVVCSCGGLIRYGLPLILIQEVEYTRLVLFTSSTPTNSSPYCWQY